MTHVGLGGATLRSGESASPQAIDAAMSAFILEVQALPPPVKPELQPNPADGCFSPIVIFCLPATALSLCQLVFPLISVNNIELEQL